MRLALASHPPDNYFLTSKRKKTSVRLALASHPYIMNPILENTSEQTSIEKTPTMEPTPLTETLAEHIAQAVAQAVAPLQKQIDRYQSQQLQQTRTLALKDALTLCQDPTFTQQTLKDFETLLGPNPPLTQALRNNLAGTYRAADRFEDADKLFETSSDSEQDDTEEDLDQETGD